MSRSQGGAHPDVSIVLPTFNRSRFLPAAFESIASQRLASWELIVVDDGGTDDTEALVDAFASTAPQSVVYVRQANRGAYGARNTGVTRVRGRYVAFYDSDDVWLPHHLADCVDALDGNTDVDWVYGACEIVDYDNGRVLDPNCFYVSGRPRPFMRLPSHSRSRGLHVIDGPGAIRCQITSGLYCGVQNSVFRRRVFDALTFSSVPRNEAEDQLFAIRALHAGFRLAYFDRIHVRYHVHGQNSSGSAKSATIKQRGDVLAAVVEGYERLPQEITLTRFEERALRRRIGRDLFWQIGYSIYWTGGYRAAAVDAYERALRTWPWDVWQWKSYVLARLRARGSATAPADVTS